MNLPALPNPRTMVVADLERMEAEVTHQIATICDLAELQEWHAKAAAVEAYFRGKSMHGPMLGAQRRVEARIGQLLGEAEKGRPNGNVPRLAHYPTRSDCRRFRILARGLEHDLTVDEWRSPRDPLVKLILERYPMPDPPAPAIPAAAVTRAARRTADKQAERIKRLAADGLLGAQIAEKLGITPRWVAILAKRAGVRLPDAAVPKQQRLDFERIVEKTVADVWASVSMVELLKHTEAPSLHPDQLGDWLRVIDRSVQGLRKLQRVLRGCNVKGNDRQDGDGPLAVRV